MAVASDKLTTALDRLAQLDGFNATGVVTLDGELLVSRGSVETNQQLLASLVSNSIAIATKHIQEAGMGEIVHMDITTTDNKSVILRISKLDPVPFIVFLLCGAETPRALVRLRLDQALPDVAKALA